MKRFRWLALAMAFALVLAFCGGDPATPPASAPDATAPVAATPTPTPAPPPPDAACVCTPTDPPSGDYRHAAKHVDMISATPQEVTVTDILAWTNSVAPAPDASRTGRELQLFHVAKAYLQNVFVVKDDCDLHMEVSAVADATAPRVVIETPIDLSYCPSRSALATALKARGLSITWGTVASIPVEITGMAFNDYDHIRGSQYVATTWELHPAVVTVLP